MAGLWQGVAGAKGSHSIVKDLHRLRDINIRIAEIDAIAHSQMGQVNAIIAEVLAETPAHGPEPRGAWDVGDRDDVRLVSNRMHERAQAALGAGFPAYARLKVLVAGERLATEMAIRFVDPPNSSRSSFVRAAFGAWARTQVEWADPQPQSLLTMLGPIDVPYRERRLHFLLAGINDFYRRLLAGQRAPDRSDLDALKVKAWDLLDELHGAPALAIKSLTDDDVAFLNRPSLESVLLQEPEVFARDNAQKFTNLFRLYSAKLEKELGDGSTLLWHAYRDITAKWDEDLRAELLSRYLGFPLWDGLLFPTVALAELPQFTAIGVTQCSPLTAGALKTPPEGKLKGVSLHHFGAFLDAKWRENDYLWGRLDGAELLLRTLQASLTPGQRGAEVVPSDPAEALQMAGGDACRDVLVSILNRENSLHRISDLVSDLRVQLAAN